MPSKTPNLNQSPGMESEATSTDPAEFETSKPANSEGQYTKEEKEAAIEVFKMFTEWRDEARAKGQIDW